MRSPPSLAPALSFALLAPLLAQEAPPRHSFGGTCTLPEGAGKGPIRLLLWHHDYNRDACEVVADVLAAADGTFRFEQVPWLARHDWGFQFFVLHAQQGSNVAMLQLRGDQAAREPLQIALKPAVTVRGHVVDSDGKPVAGAAITVRESSGAYFAAAPPPLRTTTDARGEFVLAGVPPGDTQVHCLAAKFAFAKLHGKAEDCTWDFALKPGAVVAGRVRREDGKAPARLRVCAQGQHAYGWFTTTTNDAGRYELLGLVDDRYNIWIDADDVTCAAIDGQAVELGATSEAPEIAAVAGGFFVGRVVDADTGTGLRPGDSADVAIYGPSRPRSGAGCDVAPIQADGTFRIRVAPGSNYIYLRADEAAFTPVGANSFTLPVAAGSEVKIEFRVRRSKR